MPRPPLVPVAVVVVIALASAIASHRTGLDAVAWIAGMFILALLSWYVGSLIRR